MLEGLYYGKHLSIGGGIVLLCISLISWLKYAMGWKLASVVHASVVVLLQALWHWHPCALCALCHWSCRNISNMGAVIMHYFSCSNALSCDSSYTKLVLFHVRACRGSAILLNPFINLGKNYTKPRKDCTCCTVVGFGHSLRLHTFASLICRPSGVMLNPKKVVVHCRKLHFCSLQ